ncbi:hypothetical protein TKK_0016687 [Trichogramma kaykai]
MAYADDLLLIVTGGSWQTCENQGQDMTSLIARWVDCLCLEINRAKTEMILLKNSATSGKKVTKAAGKRILGEKRVMEKKNQTGSLIRKVGAKASQLVRQVDYGLRERWEEGWSSSVKGEITREFFPTVTHRLTLEHIKLDHYVSQFLTGHVDFKAKVSSMRLSESSLCACGAEEMARHVLLDCERLEGTRIELKQCLSDTGLPKNLFSIF